MSCRRCAYDPTGTFVSEIAIHFPGLNGLNKPVVWVFPVIAVCFRCGFSEFSVPEEELSVLSKD
jgi:hypothetical protein